MSRTSESQNDIRCGGCKKCLARNGEVACPRCGQHTPIATDWTRNTALALSAHTVVRNKLTGSVPVKITVLPSAYTTGYVQFASGDLIPKRKQLVDEITALLSGSAAERRLTGTVTTASYVSFQSALEFARRIVSDYDGVPPKESDRPIVRLVESCGAQSRQEVEANWDLITRIANELLARQELDGAAIAALLTN